MIDVRTEGFVAIVTLQRPSARNALRIADWHALADAVEALDCRVAILTGEDGFCAGADLTEIRSLGQASDRRAMFREAMRRGIDVIAGLPFPVVAAIDGGCFGAGVALAIAADIRIAGADARFATTPARLGIGYPAADVARLVDRVGRGWASRMLFAAQPIDAAQALAIGLVEQIADDPRQAARVLAEAIAANAQGAVRALKRTIANPSDTSHDAAFDAAFGMPAFAEGIAAFHARRTPVFE